MNYPESISYLFGLQKFGIKLGLSNITSLLNYLDNPHKMLRCIHIAGSNGKGSTGAFLQSILKHGGYRAGFFTSPHLIDFTERIRINDHKITHQRVVMLVKQIKSVCNRHFLKNITFFEFVTAMAFKYFEEEGADPVIVEVGMGGRYDATNVIKPLLSIITSISPDHQAYLGSTLREISLEKAGIIKRNVPVISGARQPSVNSFFEKRCKNMDSAFYQLGRDIRCRKIKPRVFSYQGFDLKLKNLQCGLFGDHQIRNASLAIAASEQLKNKNYQLSENDIITGIKKTVWHGRLEIIKKNPAVVLDGAHNPAAWRTLVKTIKTEFSTRRLFLMLGVMEDKDIRRMVNILTPYAYAVMFCRPMIWRAATKQHIEKFIRFSRHKNVFWCDNVSTAFGKTLKMASKQDIICVTGSLFVVGEVREYMLKSKTFSSGPIAL